MRLTENENEKRKNYVMALHNQNPNRPDSEIQSLLRDKFGKLVHPNKIKSFREEARARLSSGGTSSTPKRKPGRPPKSANGGTQYAEPKARQPVPMVKVEDAPSVQTSLPKEAIEALQAIQGALDTECSPGTRALLSILFTKAKTEEAGQMSVEFRKEYIATAVATVKF